ncbi:MAG: cytochrome c [Candidatus Methylomirabilis oxyfera]|nr:cytochrome c [Candidatus Methylomirabilis oxyfera]
MSETRALCASTIAIAILVITSPNNALAASPRENFQRYCVQCHGPEGRGDGVNATKDLGATPKDLTNAEGLGRLTDDRIGEIIAKGGARNELSPLMPPWGNTLTGEEIRGLVRLIRDLCKCTFKP